MAYCTEDDVRTRLPEGKLEAYLRGTEVDIRGQIAAAQAEIDPMLKSMGYEVPFGAGDVPEFARALTAWKAVELLCFRIPALAEWHDRAERKAERILRQLRGGEAQPPEDVKPSTYRGQVAVVSAPGEQAERRFTVEKLKRM